MGKELFVSGKMSFDGVQYGLTSQDFTKTAAEADLTDTASPAGEKEYRTGRVDKPFTGNMWKDVNAADPPVGDNAGAGYPVILDFEGYTYSGTGYLSEVGNAASIDEGVSMSVAGRFVGVVVETPVP